MQDVKHPTTKDACRQTAKCREVKLPAMPEFFLDRGSAVPCRQRLRTCRAVPAEALHLPALPPAGGLEGYWAVRCLLTSRLLSFLGVRDYKLTERW